MNEPAYVTEAKEKAAAVRHQLSWGFEAVANIFHLLEEAGLPVVRKNMGKDGLDGIYANDGNLAVTFINTAKPRNRQRFTAAHEFGHHMFDSETGLRLDEDIFEAGDLREKRANSFAANFLMPVEGILRLLHGKKGRRLGAREVVHLSHHFVVSEEAMIYHLHNSGMISAVDRNRFIEMKNSKQLETIKWELGYVRPLEVKREPSDLLFPADYVSRAISAFMSNEITINRLAELLNETDVDALQREFETANLTPEAESVEKLIEDVEHA